MWPRLKEWFLDSETVFLARLQIAAGFLFSAATILAGLYAEPETQAAIQHIIPAEYWPYFLIGMGLLTEYLRKRRDPGMS